MNQEPTSNWRFDPDYADKLFVYAVDDLRIHMEAARNEPDHAHYHLLNVSRLLRQLLDDEAPLADLVNEKHKFELLFPVAVLGQPNRDETPTSYANFLPDLNNHLPGYAIQYLTRQEFLDGEVANFGGQAVRRSDVITVVANCLGGVHLNKKLSMRWRQTIARFDNFLRIGDLGSVIMLAQGVGNRALSGLTPLRLAVEKFHEDAAAES